MTHDQEIKLKVRDLIQQLEDVNSTYELSQSAYINANRIEDKLTELNELFDACIEVRPREKIDGR